MILTQWGRQKPCLSPKLVTFQTGQCWTRGAFNCGQATLAMVAFGPGIQSHIGSHEGVVPSKGKPKALLAAWAVCLLCVSGESIERRLSVVNAIGICSDTVDGVYTLPIISSIHSSRCRCAKVAVYLAKFAAHSFVRAEHHHT